MEYATSRHKSHCDEKEFSDGDSLTGAIFNTQSGTVGTAANRKPFQRSTKPPSHTMASHRLEQKESAVHDFKEGSLSPFGSFAKLRPVNSRTSKKSF